MGASFVVFSRWWEQLDFEKQLYVSDHVRFLVARRRHQAGELNGTRQDDHARYSAVAYDGRLEWCCVWSVFSHCMARSLSVSWRGSRARVTCIVSPPEYRIV